MQRVTGSVLARSAVLCVAGLVSLVSIGQAFAAGLVPHRAIYDMELDRAADGTGISSLNGRMVYEFSGSACEGYSVSFRFVTEFQDVSGGSQVTDLRSSTYENPKDASFQFFSKTYVDQKLVEKTRGMARQDDGKKTIELQEPGERALTISGKTLYPTEHLSKVIEAARAGKSFLGADVYDGSETGDKVYATTAVIGALITEDIPLSDDPSAAVSRIKQAEAWPVTIAYFDPAQEQDGEGTPVYQMTFLLYDNGISRQLKMDYGQFSLRGKLRQLELQEETGCTN
ncbi:cell envelope integrity EipB family protein [uncultured Roseibium sp.]|uniref:cell envelope integrity EipB family protein n=1 Tax=uncultured Roseibium sp. TaxID=1936171 RepID=UPI0032175D11